MLCSRLSREQANRLYYEVLNAGDAEALRRLTETDLFFLLTVGCKRKDMNHDWLYHRCREVEAQSDGYLDLWAREHYKSTIITFGKTMQDILASKGEITVGIFSHTRPIAKGFMNQIKREFENNEFLHDLFPDVLYRNPQKESPLWSLDGGLVVKRRTNPKEATVEAWGLVDGQPTSKHYSLLVYDDVVTLESVTTPDMINKVTGALALSLNLGAHGGRRRFIGTRYHFNDTYKTVIDRQIAAPRLHPATKDGRPDGEPVFLSRESNAAKRREQGPYVYSCQMLQDPVADKAMGFRREWLRFYDQLRNHGDWNYYVVVDPASAKKKTSDYTVMQVIGLGPDRNYYLVDGIRDRLNLTERTRKLFELVRKWRPIRVGYERYGLQSDIEHIQYEQQLQNYRFEIVELGGATPKEDRIRKLVPVFEQGRFYLPQFLNFIDNEGKLQDFVRLFIDDEYLAFPVAIHDDMLDDSARILDPALGAQFPEPRESKKPSVTMERDTSRVETDYDVLG